MARWELQAWSTGKKVAGLQHHCLGPRSQCKYIKSLSQGVSRASNSKVHVLWLQAVKKALRCCRYLGWHLLHLDWQMLQLWVMIRTERGSWDSCCSVGWGWAQSVPLQERHWNLFWICRLNFLQQWQQQLCHSKGKADGKSCFCAALTQIQELQGLQNLCLGWRFFPILSVLNTAAFDNFCLQHLVKAHCF